MASQIPPVEVAPREMSPVSRTVAWYVPGGSPLMVRSTSVRPLEISTMRARPRTLSGTCVECVSKMHTPALLDFPLPRRIASRPVDSMAETMEEGEAVPSINTNWFFRSASTLVIPNTTGQRTVSYLHPAKTSPFRALTAPETSLIQPSQCKGTANVVCSCYEHLPIDCRISLQ